MSPRTIHLRRPATLSVQEGMFVPRVNQQMLAEVDRRWEKLCQQNAAYFDGRLYHVLGVHRNGCGGAVLHVIDCAYRFFAVQDENLDLGMRALGVKGITTANQHVLVGLRSDCVASYRNMWEFAPGGSAGPGDTPAHVAARELQEETGLHARCEPTAVAVLFDPQLRCWELVYHIQAAQGRLQAHAKEYVALEWRRFDDLPQPLSPIAQQMIDLVPGVVSRNE